jgi:hypothetical protein
MGTIGTFVQVRRMDRGLKSPNGERSLPNPSPYYATAWAALEKQGLAKG